MGKISFFLDSIIWKIEYRIRAAKNLIKWHRIIWEDKQSDYSNLLIILEHKLKLQSEYWQSQEGSEAEKNSRYCKICSKLAEIVRDEYYLYELMSSYRMLIGGPNGVTQDKNDKLQSYLDRHKRHQKRMYRSTSSGVNVLDPKTRQEQEMIAMDIASYKHRKARRLLFKIMYHQLENWTEE
jgi:hypothetical protein